MDLEYSEAILWINDNLQLDQRQSSIIATPDIHIQSFHEMVAAKWILFVWPNPQSRQYSSFEKGQS